MIKSNKRIKIKIKQIAGISGGDGEKMGKSGKKSHKGFIIMIGIAATLAALIITSVEFSRVLELKTIDWRFKVRGELTPEAPIVIVAIDDASFPEMPERWTWPRTFHGEVVKNLKQMGAKVIGFDLLYSEPTAKSPEEDEYFAAEVRKAGNVIMGMVLNIEEDKNYKNKQLLFPYPELKSASKALGLVGHSYDVDSNVRKSFILHDENEERFLTLSLAMIGAYEGLDKKEIRGEEDRVIWGSHRIPIHGRNQFVINFIGPPKSFETVSYYKVYHKKDLKKDQFKGKMVLIGATADILHDVFSTPFSQSGYMMPGVEIYANMIDTIYANRYLHKMGPLEAVGLVLGVGILLSFMIFGIKAWQGLIVTAAAMTGYVFFSIYLFKNGYIISFVPPIFAMALCYLSISTYKVTVEEGEKRKIRSIFSRYVSKPLVDELLKMQEIKLGGEKKIITILFSDIRGFTTMSENMTPEQVVGILNEYLTEMTDVIFLNSGTLDKFIGDAVMALFGTPFFVKDHAMRAVRTGWEMKHRLAELNKKWESEGKRTLKIGIGINSGEVVAGNMGSLKRMEYTVIGDAVNLASRLESLNKELGTEMLISEATYKMVEPKVSVRKFENVKVKGKQEAMTVYEVTGINE